MKPITILLVACGFAAGLALGMSGPFAQAGNGLTQIMGQEAPMTARVARITASADVQRDGFKPADFSWNARTEASQALICAPRDKFSHASLLGIQHL